MPAARTTWRPRMDTKKQLWLRLRNYDFEHIVPPHLADHVMAAFGGPDASTRAFADKLARKLRWNARFALGAIDEYRKFLYLGMIADFPVTPPKVIDQVWHEHLLFTRGYRQCCDKVLGRDFDHHPELVPLDEQTATFQAQYTATRDLYRTEFDREPPAAYWGVPKFADRPEPIATRNARRRDDAGAITGYHGAPLYQSFSTPDGGGGQADAGRPEFGGADPGGAGMGGSLSGAPAAGGHGGGGHGGAGGRGAARGGLGVGGAGSGAWGGGCGGGGGGDGGAGCSS